MEIWLIRSGKRTGPYPDYEIRGRIEHGEMEPEEKVWHEGLAEWTPVGELELFRKSFGETKPADAPPALPPEYLERIVKQASELRPRLHLGRRFWARWLDLTAYSALWWLAMYFSGRDIAAAIGNTWMLLTMYLPWFAVEAWLIQRFGRTPGKWLMGLRVVNDDGSALALKPSVWRSLRVMVIGIGFGWGFLSVLCQTMSWFTARSLGKPIWDHIGGHKVVAEELSPFRIVSVVFLYVLSIYLIVAVLGPHMPEEVSQNSPNYEDYIRLKEMWYFPVKE